MEFPISRSRLQNFHSEYNRMQTEKYIEAVVESLTQRIMEKAGKTSIMSTNTSSLQIMLRELNFRGYESCGRILSHIAEIISKFQSRFPDTTISLDPMKTYMYIDWS